MLTDDCPFTTSELWQMAFRLERYVIANSDIPEGDLLRRGIAAMRRLAAMREKRNGVER